MLRTSSPGHVLVSPPAMENSNSSAKPIIPAYICWTSAKASLFVVPPVGNSSDTTTLTGRAAIAARSLRFTATAFRPMLAGETSPQRKCTPSANRSVVNTQ